MIGDDGLQMVFKLLASLWWHGFYLSGPSAQRLSTISDYLNLFRKYQVLSHTAKRDRRSATILMIGRCASSPGVHARLQMAARCLHTNGSKSPAVNVVPLPLHPACNFVAIHASDTSYTRRSIHLIAAGSMALTTPSTTTVAIIPG